MTLEYSQSEIVSLAKHPEFDEIWLHDRIADDPSLLGLGALELKDRERRQGGAGRLDLLLQDNEIEPRRRYEVEVQLGPTDESHIIRTIEYWDEERKRFPQYDHCAVLVAEDVTSRFLNVISLFNGHIPITAVKLQAIRLGDSITLSATTVLDERTLGPAEEDEETSEPADREFWEEKASREGVALADRMLEVVQEFAPEYQLNFTRAYIGLKRRNRADNFIRWESRREGAALGARVERDPELKEALEEAGFRDVRYNTHRDRYYITVTGDDFNQRTEALESLIRRAYQEGSAFSG